MYRHLLTRRWLALALAVLVLAVLCVRLGLWQFQRLDERRASNAIVEHNLAAEPVGVTRLTAVDGSVPAAEQWRPVTATGRYDTAELLLVRYQTNAGRSGVDVVVPLVTEDGTAVLVDRGFLESPGRTPDAVEVPAAPAGEVTVTGWLRADSAAGFSATQPSDGTVRAVSATALAGSSTHPLLAGWVQARDESPAPGTPLSGPELPETDSGPHFFYGLQWFFFALLALVGYLWFAYDEAHPRSGRTRAGGRERRIPVPADP